MNVSVLGPTAFQTVKVELASGESFLSEAGKMVRMSSHIQLDVTTTKGSGGGFLGGLKRLLAGDTYFLAHYKSAGGPGEVVLSPTLFGQVGHLDLDGRTGWYTTGGSYLGSGPEINVVPSWQGLKGFLSGENLVFVHCTGIGPLMVESFGMIHTQEVEGAFIVDTGHVVAFEDTLQYEITKAGSSWLNSFLSGEGLVIRFSGRGRILIQSHNPNEFGGAVGPRLPEREE